MNFVSNPFFLGGVSEYYFGKSIHSDAFLIPASYVLFHVWMFIHLFSFEQPLADVVKHVEKGYRMEAPEGCPTEIYDIMKQAWHIDPDKRPTFASVSTKLDKMRVFTV